MAKALIGHLPPAPGVARLSAENTHLRRRVRDLEGLVLRLQEENDRLTRLHAAALLDEEIQEMQPV